MNNEFEYQSDRLFSIYAYAMSHGLLLLRSGKTNEVSTRVDILFQDVRVTEIRAWFKGIKINEVLDAKFLEGQRSNPIDMVEPGNKIYTLQSSGWQGFIVAGIVRVKEDQGELFGPSTLVSAAPVERWTLG